MSMVPSGSARQPVAENILFADNGEVGRFEAAFQPEHGEAGYAPVKLRRLGEAVHLLNGVKTMRAEHGA